MWEKGTLYKTLCIEGAGYFDLEPDDGIEYPCSFRFLQPQLSCTLHFLPSPELTHCQPRPMRDSAVKETARLSYGNGANDHTSLAHLCSRTERLRLRKA